MELTTEQLNEIENLSSLFFSFEDIAALMQLDFKQLVAQFNNLNSDAAKAFKRGKLISEKQIREQIISMAKLGSPAAQVEAMKLLQKQTIKNSEHGTRSSR